VPRITERNGEKARKCGRVTEVLMFAFFLTEYYNIIYTIVVIIIIIIIINFITYDDDKIAFAVVPGTAYAVRIQS